MSLRTRFAVLVTVASATATTASGQDAEANYFPYEVGNRWVYNVEGTTSAGEVVNAQAEWRVTDVRTSPKADTLTIVAVRTDLDGRVRTGTCRIARVHDDDQFYDDLFLRGLPPPTGAPQEEIDAHWSVCLASGGFPFSSGNLTTSPYPFLRHLLPGNDSLVTAGSQMLNRRVATAFFQYGALFGPRSVVGHSTRVSATLADGIGLVETVVRESFNTAAMPALIQVDSLEIYLFGAEIGGVTYGDIGPVSIDSEPVEPSFSVRVGPNPTRDHVSVMVMCTGQCLGVHLSLIDVRGRVLLTRAADRSVPEEIDLSPFPPGVYALRAESDGKVSYHRVTLVR